MLYNLFWCIAAIFSVGMLILAIGIAVVMFSKVIEEDRVKRQIPEKVDEELEFPDIGYWEMNRAVYNARKTDKQLRKYRRNYWMAGYRN